MRGLVFSMSAFLLVYLFGVSTLTISARSVRLRRLDNTFTEVMEETLSYVMEHPECAGLSGSEVEGRFRDALYKRLGEDVGFIVSVDGFDPVMGLLSVSVTERFLYPNKREGGFTLKKTMIMETMLQEEAIYGSPCYFRFIDRRYLDTLPRYSCWRTDPAYMGLLDSVLE